MTTLLRLNPTGKIHIMPLHSSSTLCQYPEKGAQVVVDGEPTCENCLESLRDLMDTYATLTGSV